MIRPHGVPDKNNRRDSRQIWARRHGPTDFNLNARLQVAESARDFPTVQAMRRGHTDFCILGT